MSANPENPSNNNDSTAKGYVLSGKMLDEMDLQDLLALFVLDETSIEELNELLSENAERIDGDYTIWLADDYDTLPDYAGAAQRGTLAPIEPMWRSPFIGKTIPDVVAFMRNVPKPPKPLNKRFCAVLTKDEFEDGRILIYKSLEGESDSEDEGEDEDPGSVASEEDDEPPVQDAQPGSIKALLLQHSKMSYDELPPRRRPATKQAIKALGNDYEGIQVIPTAEYKFGWFHYTFAHYKWREAYVE